MEESDEGNGFHLPKRALEDRRITSGTIVRAMSPAGIYWSDSLVFPGAIYINSGDLIFTACQFDEDHQPSDFYTDFDDPRVEECRLYAALMLPLDYDGGLMLPFPAVGDIETKELFDLADASSVAALEASLRRGLARPHDTERWVRPPPPPCAGGLPYEFNGDRTPVVLQRQLFEAIDVRDHLLMRGLSAYVRSQMLIHATTFRGEGLYALFVSLDATFSLVLRHLRGTGNQAPSAYDAQEFIEAAFGDAPTGMRYFEEFYEDRIRMLHPESRFGTFPYPPISMSEGYQLSKALREVWKLLILGLPSQQRAHG